MQSQSLCPHSPFPEADANRNAYKVHPIMVLRVLSSITLSSGPLLKGPSPAMASGGTGKILCPVENCGKSMGECSVCSSPHSSISVRLQPLLTQVWDRCGTRSFCSHIFDTWWGMYAWFNAYLVSSSLPLKYSLSPTWRFL